MSLPKSSFNCLLLDVSILRSPIGDDCKLTEVCFLMMENLVFYLTTVGKGFLLGRILVTWNMGVFLLLEISSSEDCSVMKASVSSADAGPDANLSLLVSLN